MTVPQRLAAGQGAEDHADVAAALLDPLVHVAEHPAAQALAVSLAFGCIAREGYVGNPVQPRR
jgi:hypothetical protein